jgi:hypothetical protein
MAEDADLQSAIAEALEESQYSTEEAETAAEWNEWDDESETASDAEQLSKGEPDSESEEAPEGDEAQEPVPTEYWGVSLDGIPEDKARDILAKFQQQDSYIHQLQERLSQAPEPVVDDSAAEADEEITDEALLTAMGLDPESYEAQQMAPVVLPLARTVLDLEDKVDTLVTRDTTREVETQWNAQLNELEDTYGKLPFDRVQVLRYAVEEGIASPFETYFRIAAPGRKEVESVVADARRVAAKKAASGGVKPRSSGDVTTEISKDMSLRDAVKTAMKETEKETGLKWSGLFRGKVRTDG